MYVSVQCNIRTVYCFEQLNIVTSMTIARQRFGKHVPAATDKQKNRITEEVYNMVTYIRSPRSYKRDFVCEFIDSFARELRVQ
jgi:hypothetical protein